MPVLWCDATVFSLRDDGIGLMQFYAITPDASVEVARIQTSRQHVKNMVDLFCKTLDYYPDKLVENP